MRSARAQDAAKLAEVDALSYFHELTYYFRGHPFGFAKGLSQKLSWVPVLVPNSKSFLETCCEAFACCASVLSVGRSKTVYIQELTGLL